MTATPRGPRTLCLLTVGRSGSSLVAQMTGLLGMELGPEEGMLASGPFNERGYWELREIIALNDDILTALGGSLWSPPQPPAGWEHDPAMQGFRQRAHDLIARVRPANRDWAFKDPRTVHTLPLWREILGEMDYLVCVRDPNESVASFAKVKVDSPREDLMGLWIRANCTALRETAGRRRLILYYDEWFRDAEATTRRLAAFIGVEADEKMLARAREAVEPSLHHERAEGLTDEELPWEARVLDAALRRLATRDDPSLEAFVQSLDSTYESRIAQARAHFDELHSAAGELKEELGEISHRQAALETDIQQLIARLDDRDGEADELRAELDAARERHDLTRMTLEAITNSATWRLSAPIRAFRHGDHRGALRELRTIWRSRDSECG